MPRSISVLDNVSLPSRVYEGINGDDFLVMENVICFPLTKIEDFVYRLVKPRHQKGLHSFVEFSVISKLISLLTLS